MTLAKAQDLDTQFPTYREEFEIPTFGSLGITSPEGKASTDQSTYLCGNSLGLLPKSTRKYLQDELNAWGARGVESHFNHPFNDEDHTPWVDIDLPLLPLFAPIVGAKESEIAIMGSLTANLNALLIHFYKPKGTRSKILFEKGAFPSDFYALLNLVEMNGFDSSSLIQLSPKAGSTYLEMDDIFEAIQNHADELAMVMFPGIQYYTGQLFDIPAITRFVKNLSSDIIVGWDLAHAVGNVPLQLHEWNVDFAAWCNYKYVNSGPGAIAGIFVHEKYTLDNDHSKYVPRLAGWWGNNSQDRFKMLEKFDPIKSALSYRQSNPSVLDCVCVRSSLKLFAKAGGINTLRLKSIELTSFLQELLTKSPYYIDQESTDKSRLGFQILTPLVPEQRGAQLSLLFVPHNDEPSKNVMEKVFGYLHSHGVICDERRPDVIRLAPTPLYNTFTEVWQAVELVDNALGLIKKGNL